MRQSKIKDPQRVGGEGFFDLIDHIILIQLLFKA